MASTLRMKLPFPLNKAYAAWMAFSHALGRVMSTIILSVLWIVGFGLYAMIMKIGHLFRKHTPPQTYWIDCSPERPESFRQSF